MWSWCTTAQLASRVEYMRVAEEKLLSFATRFGRRHADHYEIRLTDTLIPRELIPLQSHSYDIHDNADGYIMHGVHVESKTPETSHGTPLVLLHGYMNGSSYFYRNLVGLSSYFQSVHSLDMLGWGLSSRPNFKLTDNSVEKAEDFFVESLEAWRVQNKIPKIILAGHSIGGYCAVAYCERYPQHVERLVLLSPAGVTEETEEVKARYDARFGASIRTRMMSRVFKSMFDNSTAGAVLRMLPQSRGQNMIEQYIQRRLPAIEDADEQKAVAEYLYYNAVLPGSGEYCLNRFLTPYANGRKPTLDRIPNLKVPHVSFLYGSNDWMDSSGGLQVQLRTEEMQKNGKSAPDVHVYRVKQAGHLLMLDNWEEFNAGVILSSGGGRDSLAEKSPVPIKLNPHNKEHHQSTFSGWKGEKKNEETEQMESPNIEVAPA